MPHHSYSQSPSKWNYALTFHLLTEAATLKSYLAWLFEPTATASLGIQNTTCPIELQGLVLQTNSDSEPSLEVTASQHLHSWAQSHHLLRWALCPCIVRLSDSSCQNHLEWIVGPSRLIMVFRKNRSHRVDWGCINKVYLDFYLSCFWLTCTWQWLRIAESIPWHAFE